MAKYIDVYQAEEVLARQLWLNKTDLITAVGALKLLVPAADVVEAEQLRSYERTIVKLNEALQEKQEVKHGRWIEEKGKVAKCSVCKKETEADIWGQYWLSPYCPNCGARMDGEQE